VSEEQERRPAPFCLEEKMSETVVVAIISLLGTLFGTFGGIVTSNKLTGYRIEQLEKKVDKHNNVIERVFRLEDQDRLLDEKINVANHRIADLEAKGV
jgi:hypothetical protein